MRSGCCKIKMRNLKLCVLLYPVRIGAAAQILYLVEGSAYATENCSKQGLLSYQLFVSGSTVPSN